jgi:hypothetical protein
VVPVFVLLMVLFLVAGKTNHMAKVKNVSYSMSSATGAQTKAFKTSEYLLACYTYCSVWSSPLSVPERNCIRILKRRLKCINLYQMMTVQMFNNTTVYNYSQHF